MATATQRRPKKRKPPKPVVRYEWRDGGRFPIKAEVAARELERIAAADGGGIKPPAVVEAARPEDAPLHSCFEWDDKLAEELHREESARNLIRSVRIVREEGVHEASPEIMFVHVDLPEVGKAYAAASVVMGDADLRKQALADAVRLLNGVRRRYEHLEELRPVFQAIDRLEEAG